ncbi:MAG: hypothetical protein IKO47_07250 [Ruminococcus sp.]|nr:hypothetical protein [Ruminococcus sp.]
MNKKNRTGQRLPRRKHPYLNTAKAVMIVLTLIYPMFMVMMTGAGIILHRDVHGAAFGRCGVWLIVSGVMMTAGTVLCMFRKSITNLISPFLSGGGFLLCMYILTKLVKRADANGWRGPGIYEGVTMSYLFKSRLIPCILPVALAVTVALCQYFSYDLGEQRRERKREKLARENAPAPKILDD